MQGCSLPVFTGIQHPLELTVLLQSCLARGCPSLWWKQIRGAQGQGSKTGTQDKTHVGEEKQHQPVFCVSGDGTLILGVCAEQERFRDGCSVDAEEIPSTLLHPVTVLRWHLHPPQEPWLSPGPITSFVFLLTIPLWEESSSHAQYGSHPLPTSAWHLAG